MLCFMNKKLQVESILFQFYIYQTINHNQEQAVWWSAIKFQAPEFNTKAAGHCFATCKQAVATVHF